MSRRFAARRLSIDATRDCLRRLSIDMTRGCPGYEAALERNWCGNVHFGAKTVEVPSTISELQRVVREADALPLRVVGRGHSFSDVAECRGGTLVSLTKLNNILSFEPPCESTNGGVGSVTIEGGVTYTEVCAFLAEGRRGALHNLPSCPQFTVAGAIATGTHGSGVHLANLAAAVSMIEFVAADGSLVRYDTREGQSELVEGARVHLGCLGVVSRLRLDVIPSYDVDARTYADADLRAVLDALPALWASCDSLSVWTSGMGLGPGAGRCWLTLRHFVPHGAPIAGAPERSAPERSALLGGALLREPMGRYCAGQASRADDRHFWPTRRGSWHSHLTLTLADDGRETDMSVVDLQAEWFVPLEAAREAAHAVWEAARSWSFSAPPHDQASTCAPRGLVDAIELRQVKGDGAWLSPQPSDALGIHVSFNGEPHRRVEVRAAVASLEAALEPFGARAHWGKLGARAFEPDRVEALYADRLRRFRELCAEHDPHGKFQNEHVKAMLFSAAQP